MGPGILEGDGLSSPVQLDPEGALLLPISERQLFKHSTGRIDNWFVPSVSEDM